MKMKLEKSFQKLTFNSQTNDFDEEWEEAREEVKLPKKFILLNILGYFVCIIVSLALLGAGIALALIVTEEFCLLTFASFVTALVGARIIERAYEWLYEEWARDEGVWTWWNSYYDLWNDTQQETANIWRELHPLEEKCRLAMTQNPNYVADLIRYVKNENL